MKLRYLRTQGRRSGVGHGVAIALALSYPAVAHAYVGPGAGLTAIGTLVALVLALLLAVVGFVWYPIKRLRQRRKADPHLAETLDRK